MSQPTSRGGARSALPRSAAAQRLPPSLPAGGAWESRQQERQPYTSRRSDQRAVGSSDGRVRSTLPRSVTPQRLPAGGGESRQQDRQRPWHGPSEQNRNPGDVSRRRLGAPAPAPSYRTQRSPDQPVDDGAGGGLLAAQRRLNQVLLDRLDLYVLAALRSNGPRWPYPSPS